MDDAVKCFFFFFLRRVNDLLHNFICGTEFVFLQAKSGRLLIKKILKYGFFTLLSPSNKDLTGRKRSNFRPFDLIIFLKSIYHFCDLYRLKVPQLDF